MSDDTEARKQVDEIMAAALKPSGGYGHIFSDRDRLTGLALRKKWGPTIVSDELLDAE